MEPIKEHVIIGVDEAGRGSLFGPIFAAAVVLNHNIFANMGKDKKLVLRDSKKMTHNQRTRAKEYIEQNVYYGIGYCDPQEIDNMGINHCNVLAMHRAIDNLLDKHGSILIIDKINVDGVLFQKYKDVPYELIIRGDSTHPEISAASILAKTNRDNMIQEICIQSPSLDIYGLQKHKGYGTKEHITKIKQHGPSPMHRESFIKNFYTIKKLRFLSMHGEKDNMTAICSDPNSQS